jgi:hypothetical protein
LCLLGITVLLAGCSTVTVDRSAPATFAGPDDVLVRMAKAGIPCRAATAERRATEDGGVSVVCASGEALLIVTTYPSADVRAQSLRQAAAVIDEPADVLVGNNWTVACEAAGNCDRLAAVLGGTVARV